METASPSTTLAQTASSTSNAASASCTTAIPGKYGHVPVDACNSNYVFDPSFGGNLAFAVLMGLTTLVHLIQAILYKKGYSWVLIMGASWECAAFALRAVGAHHQQQEIYAIMGTLLLLLAPLWINAFLYMTVARLIYYILPERKIWGFKATLLTKLFVWLDIVSFLVQATGGIMLSSTDAEDEDSSLVRSGQKVYMAGIGVQAAFIVIFGSLTGRFYYKMKKENRSDRPVRLAKWFVWVLYAVFLLIIVRIIFRLVEFAPGFNTDNPIITNENYTFGLDALPVFLGLALLNMINPGMVLRGPESTFPKLSRKEKKALKKNKKEQKRARKEEKKQLKADRKLGIQGHVQTYEMFDSDSNGRMV